MVEIEEMVISLCPPPIYLFIEAIQFLAFRNRFLQILRALLTLTSQLQAPIASFSWLHFLSILSPKPHPPSPLSSSATLLLSSATLQLSSSISQLYVFIPSISSIISFISIRPSIITSL